MSEEELKSRRKVGGEWLVRGWRRVGCGMDGFGGKNRANLWKIWFVFNNFCDFGTKNLQRFANVENFSYLCA